jgi:Protein of unknown function (DUF3396)
VTRRWLGSQRPDVVLHFTRNATRIQCIYDFKFPCDTADRRNPLADSRTEAQLRKYEELGNETGSTSWALPSFRNWPEAGDLTRGNALPSYRELGRVLEPWLDKPFNAPRFRVEGFTQEEAISWARRFLD